MKRVIKNYREFFSDFPAVFSTLISFIFFIVSLIVNFFASQYAYKVKGSHVPDILLDNLPVVNMDTPFIAGTILFVAFVTILLITHPRKVAFTMKAMAIFIIVRSIFICMTHIGPSPLSTLSSPGEIGRAFTSGADLFFSGHTGMPYLFALIFWHNVKLRYTFIIISIFAAAGVLLGHIHYSIDVASAYFITFCVYIMTERMFKKDRETFFK